MQSFSPFTLHVAWKQTRSYNHMGREQSNDDNHAWGSSYDSKENSFVDFFFSDAFCTESCFFLNHNQASCKEISETKRPNCQPL